MLEHSYKEWLGKHVYGVLQSVNLPHHNLSCSNSISDVVLLDTNKFGLGVVDIVLGKINNTLAIGKHNNNTLWNTKLSNKTSQPSSFLHALSIDNVIDFYS